MNAKKRTSAKNVFYCAVGLSLTLTGSNIAQTTGNESAKPLWPDNGIAQRKLPGAYNMFVEQDKHGQWHAWVMNGEGKDAQALDFFSGKQMHVEAGVDEDSGHQTRDFVDAAGSVHTPALRGFDFTLTGPGGFRGGIWFGGESLELQGKDDSCSASFIGVQGGGDKNNEKIDHPKWIKFPIYHDVASDNDCPGGYLRSTIHTAMDLDDGTFLATMNCWVFRLRKSNLSPVGDAPALRVVDKKALQTAIEYAKGKNIQDANTYLAKALNLSFYAANSCNSGY